MENNHPLAVYCKSCGAPANYDIVRQQYLCQYCGGVTDVKDPIMRLEKWRDARRKAILEGENADAEVHSCQNCGAQVIIPKGEAMGKCGFCGGKFARRAFGKSDELPEVIIPFVLTEDEAREKLAEWGHSNSRKKEAQAVLANIQELRGYYLPYELIRGPMTAQVQRLETFSDRKYNMGGFLNGIAVNTSKQLDNLVLDAMEPFEWTAARPFEFAFIAGQRVKLSDVDGLTLENRVLEEVEDSFRQEAEQALQTTGVTINMQAGHLLRLPALLPVYVLSIGPVLAVVNGQTGRTAVTNTKLSKNYSWLIEPTVLTVLTTGAMCLFDVLVGLMWGAIFGIIFFVAFADGRGDEWRRKVFKMDSLRPKRIQARLTVNQGQEPVVNSTVKALFLEPVNGRMEPVRVAFYTPLRMLKIILGVLVFNTLPAICAFLLDFEGTANYSYLGAWLVLTVPVTLILWVAVGRIRIYNFPLFKVTLADGSTRQVKSDNDKHISFKEALNFIKELADYKEAWILVGFLIFMLLGTVGAILMPD
ncbi:hypothetical protein [uncultured Anaerovibrio sp.]|uniref:hypothetical protein n=1 Tax=uncultured Anaerovibrio sp. TaxID=361586 RepID=UPI00261E8675|nr:hypothetical protein [uncultured Anaerovibrio sp.]